jgi:integrase
MDVRDFVIHDFRRTASTRLHEAGFNSDWIEKALAHETKGIRGVYNRAQYADQRKEMLQWWADFVDAQIEEGRKVIIGRFGTDSRL